MRQRKSNIRASKDYYEPVLKENRYEEEISPSYLINEKFGDIVLS